MREENPSMNDLLPESDPVQPVDETPSPASSSRQTPPEATPPRPEYTKKQRVIALLGAIFVVVVTLMYTYSIATGDLFFR